MEMLHEWKQWCSQGMAEYGSCHTNLNSQINRACENNANLRTTINHLF